MSRFSHPESPRDGPCSWQGSYSHQVLAASGLIHSMKPWRVPMPALDSSADQHPVIMAWLQLPSCCLQVDLKLCWSWRSCIESQQACEKWYCLIMYRAVEHFNNTRLQIAGLPPPEKLTANRNQGIWSPSWGMPESPVGNNHQSSFTFL